MKTLILLRHAKTEPQSLIKTDFERRLTDVGKERQYKISAKLTELNIVPDCILCSTAIRTKETLTELLSVTKWNSQLYFHDELYHASASEILNTLKKYEASNEQILVIGHNFGISTLANLLSKTGAEEMVTSGVHILHFDDAIELYQGDFYLSLKPKTV